MRFALVENRHRTRQAIGNIKTFLGRYHNVVELRRSAPSAQRRGCDGEVCRHAVERATAGLGTVGGGTVRLLQANAELLEKRTARGIRIVAVSDHRYDRGFPVDDYVWYDAMR